MVWWNRATACAAMAALLMIGMAGCVTEGQAPAATGPEVPYLPSAVPSSGHTRLDGTFGLPWPTPGDIAIYATSDPSLPRVDIEWNRTSIAPDDQGVWGPVFVVDVRRYADPDGTRPVDDPIFTRHGYLPRTNTQVTWIIEETSNETKPVNLHPGILTSSHTRDQRHAVVATSQRTGDLPCGAHNIFQGANLALDRHYVDTVCGQGDMTRDGNGWVHQWVPAGRPHDNPEGLIVERRAVVMRDGEEVDRQIEQRLVFAPDLPFPVEIEDVRGEGSGATWSLTSFVRGDGPKFDVPAEVRQPPKVAWAPREPWGLSEAGVDHHAPLSAAWKLGVQSYGPLRDFVAEHPDAYVARTQYQDLDGQALRWFFIVADGDATLRVVAEHQASVVPGSPLFTFREDDRDGLGDLTFLPGAEQVAVLPTVASLQALYAWATPLHGQERAPNAWEFWLECDQQPCEPRMKMARVLMSQDETKGGIEPLLLPGEARRIQEAYIEVADGGEFRATGHFERVDWYE